MPKLPVRIKQDTWLSVSEKKCHFYGFHTLEDCRAPLPQTQQYMDLTEWRGEKYMKKDCKISLHKFQKQAKLSNGVRGLGWGSNGKGFRGLLERWPYSGFLAWELVKRVCLIYENSSNCTHVIVHFCMYITFK